MEGETVCLCFPLWVGRQLCGRDSSGKPAVRRRSVAEPPSEDLQRIARLRIFPFGKGRLGKIRKPPKI